MGFPKPLDWVPEVTFLDGNDMPWQAWAVKGDRKVHISAYARKVWPHTEILSAAMRDGEGDPAAVERIAAAFYKGARMKRRQVSGKVMARRDARDYCDLRNRMEGR